MEDVELQYNQADIAAQQNKEQGITVTINQLHK